MGGAADEAMRYGLRFFTTLNIMAYDLTFTVTFNDLNFKLKYKCVFVNKTIFMRY